MNYFLLVYDTRAGRLLEDIVEYGPDERAVALRDRFRRETKERDRPQVEVVLLGASSREALERTHSRYFHTPGELAASAG